MKHALAAAALVGTLAAASLAHATVVERVVAIVGDKPILLSELQERCAPRLTLVALHAIQRGATRASMPMQLASAEPAVLKETLDDIIDEVLIQQQARKAHVSVSTNEVMRALSGKAEQLGIDPDALMALARAQGYSDQGYRDEIRRQLLEGKLLQLRLVGTLHITPGQNLQAEILRARTAWLLELRRAAYVDVRL